MRTKQLFATAGVAIVFALAGCSSQEAAAAANVEADAATTEVTGGAAPAVATSGRVVEVKMVTEGANNVFEPKNVTVSRGDVVRFVLVSGVHNVSFPPAINASASALPPAVPYLQAPGQSHDIAIDVPVGTYTFQCDPHAVLGMVGTLTVQ